MNRMKNELDTELHTIRLSSGKKKEIVYKAMHRNRKYAKAGKWQYRTVLASFIVLVLSFSTISWMNKDIHPEEAAVSAAGEKAGDLFTFFQYDSFKALLLFGVFLVVYAISKKSIQKNNKTFPVCVNCGEEWTRKESLRIWKNKEVSCPYCEAKQFQTKKSTMRVSMFNLPIPFMILSANLFNNALIGAGLHLLLVAILFISLVPYYMAVQKDNPDNEPLW